MTARELTVPVLRKILEAFGWEDAIKPTTKKRRKDNLKYKHPDKPGKQVQAHSPHPEHCWDTRTSTEILKMAELDWQDIEDKEEELGKTF
jgi:hypothetical protein